MPITTGNQILDYIRRMTISCCMLPSTCAIVKNGTCGRRLLWTARDRFYSAALSLLVLNASVFPFALPLHSTAMLHALTEKISGVPLKGKEAVVVDN